jgi:hypothetical protein
LLCVIDRCGTSVCSSCGSGVYSRSSYNSGGGGDDDGGGGDDDGDDGGGDDGGGCSNDVHPLMLVGLQL